MKIKLDDLTKQALIRIQKTTGIYLEGNILKLLDTDDNTNTEFKQYFEKAIWLDKENRKKRLEITKQIQSQNRELISWKKKNSELMSELEESLKSTQTAKEEVQKDLDILQKKIQTELIGTIVKVSLITIVSIGLISTTLYIIALFLDKDTTLLGNAWSNMFGILLTNCFSIIGTIMGVKYASNKN